MRPRSRHMTDAPVLASVVIIGVAVVGGVVAALLGGAFTDLGEGAGGLWGMPSLVTTMVALVAIPVAVVAARRATGLPRRWWAFTVVAGGAWMVAIGYFVIAHAADPCANGWWDGSSRFGDQPLCERFGTDLNWHTRYHLLAHALPAVPLVVLYAWAVRRWATPPPATDEVPLGSLVSTLD